MEWYFKVFRNYTQFGGRARRKEYWMFTLFNFFVSIVLGIIQAILDWNEALTLIYSLVILLPGLAVFVRRLHDTGRSAWWILLGLIPLIGGIILLVFTCMDSEPGMNQYGPNPKESSF